MAEYKIRDLENLTGIKAHTLRIWEKRYGILVPDRTETQIRTYTDEELTLILKISMLNKNGSKISKIADMNVDQITDHFYKLNKTKSDNQSVELFILSLVNLDEQLFKDTFQDLINRVGLQDTFINYLMPFLDRIGVMWLVGTITPAQEHFISNLIRQKIVAEIDKLSYVANIHDNPVFLFLPEHEWHEISLLFYAYCMKQKQIPVIYFGQSLPYDALLESIQRFKPRALVTSWLTSVDQNFMRSYFKQLHEESEQVPIYAGGYQINQHSELLEEWVIEIKSIDVLVGAFDSN